MLGTVFTRAERTIRRPPGETAPNAVPAAQGAKDVKSETQELQTLGELGAQRSSTFSSVTSALSDPNRRQWVFVGAAALALLLVAIFLLPSASGRLGIPAAPSAVPAAAPADPAAPPAEGAPAAAPAEQPAGQPTAPPAAAPQPPPRRRLAPASCSWTRCRCCWVCSGCSPPGWWMLRRAALLSSKNRGVTGAPSPTPCWPLAASFRSFWLA